MTADMNANRFKYFRWTPRTAWITFVYVAVVPSVLGYIGYVTEVSGLLLFTHLLFDGRIHAGLMGEKRVEEIVVVQGWVAWDTLLMYGVVDRANTS